MYFKTFHFLGLAPESSDVDRDKLKDMTWSDGFIGFWIIRLMILRVVTKE